MHLTMPRSVFEQNLKVDSTLDFKCHGGRIMQNTLLREIEKRIINGFMDFILVLALSGNGGCFSGYDAIKYIHKSFHFLPSPGTVYAHLYAMERAGWLKGIEEGRRRIYCITEKGLELAKEFDRVNGNVQKLFAQVFSKNGNGFSR
jgi:DNA-binding PadR family transcriptional regulator